VRPGVVAADLVVERADILSPVARALIGALNAELSSGYPEDGATTPRRRSPGPR